MANAKNTSTSTRKATSKAQAAPPVVVAPAPAPAQPVAALPNITPNQWRILGQLAAGSVTRKQVAQATGILKGYSKALGAPSKRGGTLLPHTLGARGLVACSYVGPVLHYTVTPAGQQALAAQRAANPQPVAAPAAPALAAPPVAASKATKGRKATATK